MQQGLGRGAQLVAGFTLALAGVAVPAALFYRSRAATPAAEASDDLERRLQAELQRTSYTEWRAAGFEPNARAPNPEPKDKTS
mmetsp:Transcript_151977/g.268334  ORF Transcript_151977/g.268334 Transcript_151977/m.268334 type:complete len:83 (-) Transcript_151977:147-395(-)